MTAPRRLLPVLLLAAAAVAPLWRAVFAARVLFYRDVHLAWYPAVEGFVRAIAQGAWPLWDPAPSFGQPLLADPQWMIAYPPTWLNLVMPPWTYYVVFAAAHLWWSAAGTYALCRRWRCSPAAALAGACAWTWSGPALSLVSLYHHFASACWMPWVFLAGERALVRRRRRDVALCGATMAAQILAGSADVTAMTWLAFAAYAAARFLRWRRPLVRRNRELLGAAAASAALAVALSAVLWMPALDLVSRSARRDLPADARTYWSLHPLALLEAWLPGLWHLRGLRPALSSLLFENREAFLDSIYLGIATVPLAAAALAARRPRSRLLAAIAGLALLVALGRHFVAYPAVTALLPPLRILRYPVKAYVPFAWMWALLCAQGVEAWRRARVPAAAWTWTAGAGALAAAAAATAGASLLGWPGPTAALLVTPGNEGALAVKAWALLAAAAAGLVACVLALARARRPARAPRLAAAAAVVALADLLLRGVSLIPTAPRTLYGRPAVVDLLRAQGAQRVHAYAYMYGDRDRQLRNARVPSLAAVPAGWSLPAAAALAQELCLAPATAGRWALESGFEGDPVGLHPSGLAEVERLLPLLEGTPLHLRLLRLGGITHVLAFDDMPELRPLATLPSLLESPLRVYAVPGALPRAFAVGASRTAAHGGVLLQPDFDAGQEVALDPGEPVLGSAPGPAGRVTVLARRADALALQADMEREGYLVLLETYDPGWRVQVDGRPQRLLRANLAFRALRLPPGRHAVRMVYRPAAVTIGAAVTLAGLLAAIALARIHSWRA